ncbi:TPA: hypothetical protein DEO28_01720 [Candidatus Dependentiae bacterium]|nr:MAG: Penicillin-binding protein [candidate division TM6 bacterium GW2011_GWE2_31_21]KKP52951.1 MAG: Penicillin-binding protein [candidate division TM6 bacterium GW2011_GWF2_33_332]HBS47810.1 hypothetical protein [Candidatus Dependentiae bacterium]HBZ73214.1 hypothetical protein [Candidatus Dependentiae bacterium]
MLFKQLVKEIFKVERHKRIIFLIFGITLIALIIAARLFYLQVIMSSALKNRSDKNCFKFEVIYPPRGNLLDCNNAVIASNRPMYDLIWEGSGHLEIIENHISILKKIFEILEKKEFFEQKLEDIIAAEKLSRRIKIFEDIPFEQLCMISELCCSAKNLIIVNRFKRFYPYNSLASHILGYLSGNEDCGISGKYGIEKAFQNELEGEKGYVVHVVNATGKRLRQEGFREPQAGTDIKLTLDLKMQQLAEEAFGGNKTGSVIIINPKDGAIKVMASFPNFDPNIFLSHLSTEEWHKLFGEKSPFLNRVLNALYPPASVFKLIIYATGLQQGIINKNSRFCCHGHIDFGGRQIFCMNHKGHGELNARQALALSCNIPCFEMAKQLKIDTIAQCANKFGLGKKTGFLIAEKDGIIPTAEWKMKTLHEKWWMGENLSVAIGQSYTLVTPIQIARMVGGIMTGYLVRPRILEQEEIQKESIDVKPEILSFLQDAMKDVALYGSARSLSIYKDFAIYAKTGTAQVASLERSKGNSKLSEHGWLACSFSYKNEEPLVMVILTEKSGYSGFSVAVARRFFQLYLDMRLGKIRVSQNEISLSESSTNVKYADSAKTASSFTSQVVSSSVREIGQ